MKWTPEGREAARLSSGPGSGVWAEPSGPPPPTRRRRSSRRGPSGFARISRLGINRHNHNKIGETYVCCKGLANKEP